MKHNNKAIIKLENIQMIFKVKSQDVQVLKDINLEIKENDFNIIFGPSGCGKSTLLHIILGLEAPTSGKIVFLDKQIYDYTEDERSQFRKENIGMIYQQPNWIKSLSVVENVAFAASVSGKKNAEARKLALEKLQLVGMQDWADYFPTELSSGQQQKVSLARALVTNPKIIIADEPTGNLDHKSGIDLMNLFNDLVKQGKTVIMVTHDLNMIDYSTVVIQMFDGRIVKLHTLEDSTTSSIKKEIVEKVYKEDENKVKSFRFALLDKPIKNVRHGFKQKLQQLNSNMKYFWSSTAQVFSFLGVLVIYLNQQLFLNLAKFKYWPKFLVNFFSKIATFITEKILVRVENELADSISRVDLISLSLRNMQVKKTRTMITIGGMAIGVGLIVFLVSVGYGLEKMVISRVARLEEMKHVDTTPTLASNLHIDDKTLADFKAIPEVSKVLPVIGVVGKVSFQNSVTDIVVYGVMSDYLTESAIKPIRGNVFASNNLNKKIDSLGDGNKKRGEVAGVRTYGNLEYLAENGQVEYKIEPDKFIRVRQSPSSSGKIIGYTRRVEGVGQAMEVVGKSYTEGEVGDIGEDANGQRLGLWLKAMVPVWKQENCVSGENSCELGKFLPVLDESGKQVQETGYFAQLNMTVNSDNLSGSVLGETTSVDSNFIDISALEATKAADNTKTVTLATTGKREVIVDRAFLKVLGLAENEAIDKIINLSFVVTSDLTPDNNKIISEPAEYAIVGITGDDKSPVVYVPIGDIKSMGVTNYSLAKVVVDTPQSLPKIRKQIEALGYQTTSVVDTVSQIEQLFVSVQLILGVLGVVSLSVAALGMFNTLTVSLLERTREVGMMKAIGMKSMEVRDLFLTESMIMGLFGGIGGLALGFFGGKLFSLFLSAIALTKGVGIIDITYIPMPFVVFITVVSVIVGILTGIYPSHRATKISALNALRYE